MSDHEDRFVSKARARVGTLLKGKWHLDALLGYGGMAAVYAATHRNGHQVAIKLLHPHLAAEQRLRERFLREGYVANTVEHPGAVRVVDDDSDDGETVFLVMELLDGETLDQRAGRKGGRLPIGEVMRMASSLLDTLEAAHKRGVFHRDIKPENIFLTRGGGVKILDFGIALLRELAAEGVRTTRSGATTGTPAFMSPEQALGKSRDVDGRSDIYQVGATMFTLLTGRLVHESESVNEMLVMAATQPAAAISTIMPDLPDEVCDIVDCALQFDIADRFPDAAAMKLVIDGAIRQLDLHDISLNETPGGAHLASVPPPPVRAHRKAFEQARKAEAEADAEDEVIEIDAELIPRAPPSPYSLLSPIPPVVIRGPNSLPSFDVPPHRAPDPMASPPDSVRSTSRQKVLTVALGVIAIIGGMGTRAYLTIRSNQAQASADARVSAARTSVVPASGMNGSVNASSSGGALLAPNTSPSAGPTRSGSSATSADPSAVNAAAEGGPNVVAATTANGVEHPDDPAFEKSGAHDLDFPADPPLEASAAVPIATTVIPGVIARPAAKKPPPAPRGRDTGPLLEKRH